MEVGDRVRCVEPGSTRLRRGFVYRIKAKETVGTFLGVKGGDIYQVDDGSTVLYAPWRFEKLESA